MISKNLQLFCEHMQSPNCVQSYNPRFSWRFSGELPPAQTAYRLLISDDKSLLSKNTGNCFDSGQVMSQQSICVEYSGEKLRSRTAYYWKVFVYCDSNEPFESDIAEFTTAIFSNSEWSACWISASVSQPRVSRIFRREFNLKEHPDFARIYVCGLGIYHLYINGIKVGDRYLEPGWTDYNKTILYSVYDVADMLCVGDNVIAAELGDGHYGLSHPSLHCNSGNPAPWGGTPKLLFEMDLLFGDRSEKIISRENDGWMWTDNSVIFNDIFDGEMQAARMEPKGWRTVGAPSGTWYPAIAAEAPTGRLKAQIMPPIRITQLLEPKSIRRYNDSRWLIDFGQNFAGWAKISFKGINYTRISFKYGETITDDGFVNQYNLRGARSEDVYMLGADEADTFEPRFIYHGFRYVEVTCERPLETLSAVGCVVHTDVTRIGNFETSDPLLSDIYNAVIWTERSNLHALPTDCPQRDERQAWLNDLTVRCEESMLNFDMVLFYEKWLGDIVDAQAESGSIPDTAPLIYGDNPALHITSSFVLIPWFIYIYYGDLTVLRKYYPYIKKYICFKDRARQDGLLGEPFCGEWAPPITEGDPEKGFGVIPKSIPAALVTTGYLHYDAEVMKKAAVLLGYEDDITYYERLTEETKRDINRHFFNEQSKTYQPSSQGSNVFPLFLGIVPDGYEKPILDAFVKDIESRGYHTSTGNQLTKRVFEVLDMFGRNDIALKLAKQTTYPSLGYMLENGATTIWERWEKLEGSGMNSHNHPMHASYTSWYFKSLCGLRFERIADGLQTVVIEPSLFEDPTYARADYQTPKGLLSFGWRFDKHYEFILNVPWNMSVKLYLPEEGTIFCGGISAETTEGKRCLTFAHGKYFFKLDCVLQ